MGGGGFTLERAFNTRCYVTVYRHGGDPIQLVGELTQRHHQGGPVALVRASHNKTLASPSGTWSIGLKEGKLDVRSEIQAGDWVVIHWTRNGEKLHGMLGAIDRVERSRRSVEGLTDEDWTISGRDFARIFEITSVWFDDYSNYQNNAGGQILGSRMGFVPGGAPNFVVNRIISAWLGQGNSGRGIVGGPWRWPQGLGWLGEFFADGLVSVVGGGNELPIGDDTRPVSVFDFFRTGAIPLRGEAFNEAALFSPNAGTFLYDLLNEWSNPILNELYFDSVTTGPTTSTPEKPIPAVFHREKPFVNESEGINSPWFKIPTRRLPFDSPLSMNVSTNDAERLNLFLIYATGIGSSNFDQYLLYPPSYDPDALSRHGLRKWEQSTRFSAVANGTGNWPKELAQWHTLVTSWYGLNHEFVSGTVELPFIYPEARIGERLVFGKEGDVDKEQYYIEGNQISWSFPQGGTTSLTLTRGWRGTDASLVQAVRAQTAKFIRRTVQGIPGLEGVRTDNLQKFAAHLSGQQDVDFERAR